MFEKVTAETTRVVVEIMQNPWTNNVAPGWYQYKYTCKCIGKKIIFFFKLYNFTM